MAGEARRLEGEEDSLSVDAMEEEKTHFQKVVNAFLYYKWAGLSDCVTCAMIMPYSGAMEV